MRLRLGSKPKNSQACPHDSVTGAQNSSPHTAQRRDASSLRAGDSGPQSSGSVMLPAPTTASASIVCVCVWARWRCVRLRHGACPCEARAATLARAAHVCVEGEFEVGRPTCFVAHCSKGY